MTTGLFASSQVAAGHELHHELGRMRAVILALLAALCITTFTAVTVRFERQAATTAPEAAEPVAVIEPEESAPAAPEPTPVIARKTPPEVEAIAAHVARKYRIAPEATRSMVETTFREASRIGVDPLLVLAIISVESRFNPIAESEFGAQGLMQVIPGYHKNYFEAARVVDSVLDPAANIRLGALVLKEYIKRGGTEVAGLQLYNGSSDDPSNAYAGKVLAERQQFQQVAQRVKPREHA